MSRHCILVVLVLVMRAPSFADASVDGFVESFSGTGEFSSVGGTFDGLDNPGWAMNAEGELTERGYAFDVVDHDPLDSFSTTDSIERLLTGTGSYLQEIVIEDLVFWESNSLLGPVSGISLSHHFVAGEVSPNMSVSLAETHLSDETTWQFSVTSLFPSGRGTERVLVPRAEKVRLSIYYDQESATVTGSYDNLLNAEPPLEIVLPMGGEMSDSSIVGVQIGAEGQGNAKGILSSWSLMPVSGVEGDYNGNGLLDITDANLLSAAIRFGENDPTFDANMDDAVDQLDLGFWVHELKSTWFGDADLNGEFNSADLVNLFQLGEYEDDVEDNSTWGTGDWSADGEFTTSDLVVAFQDGGYEQGPRRNVSAVPEPSTALLLAIATAFTVSRTRRNRF